MAERMTSESCRVVRFRWYTVLWPEESAETINQSVSRSQVNNMTSRTLVYTIKRYSNRFITDSHKNL